MPQPSRFLLELWQDATKPNTYARNTRKPRDADGPDSLRIPLFVGLRQPPSRSTQIYPETVQSHKLFIFKSIQSASVLQSIAAKCTKVGNEQPSKQSPDPQIGFLA
jgi:hypothetical protein